MKCDLNKKKKVRYDRKWIKLKAKNFRKTKF